MVCATNEGLYATCGKYRPGTLRFCSVSSAGEERLAEFPMDVAMLSQTAADNVRVSNYIYDLQTNSDNVAFVGFLLLCCGHCRSGAGAVLPDGLFTVGYRYKQL